MEQRIRALKATYGGAVIEDNGARRRELQGLVASTCPARETYAARRGNLRQGGPQMVCVRTCDGGFFPMRNLPEGRGGADEMCQALCPGTEAQAYSMPYGDDALKHAASVEGQPGLYAASPTPSSSARNSSRTAPASRRARPGRNRS